MMWTRYFLEAQGYKVNECILNQDNMSAMLLETNGKQSSSKWTKHIRVRYFFIKDRVSNGNITLKHCPTGEMLADHFTKPLQGTLFRKFRAEIQGIPVDTNEIELGWDRAEGSEGSKGSKGANPSPQECVGPSGQDPRPRESRLRRRYLMALQPRVRQAGSSESAMGIGTSRALQPSKRIAWSKDVSYAHVWRGTRDADSA
jgi:hypothetical protein